MELYTAYLRLLVAFPLVLFLAYFGLRFLLSRFNPGLARERKIQVVERVALQARTYLYVVKAGNEYLLLGTSQHGVHLVKELGDDWMENGLASGAITSPAGDNKNSFSQLLKHLRGKQLDKESFTKRVTAERENEGRCRDNNL